MLLGITDFQWKMANLDAALTGKPDADVIHTVKGQAKSAQDWLASGREWYLSDGGYSRLVYNDVTGHLFFTSNSLDRVKLKWKDCKELIQDVEKLLTEG